MDFDNKLKPKPFRFDRKGAGPMSKKVFSDMEAQMDQGKTLDEAMDATKPKGMPQGAVPLDQVQVSEGEKHNREVMAKAGVNNPEAVAEAVPESQEPAQMSKEIRDKIANFIYVSEQMYIMAQSGQGKVDDTEASKLRQELQKLGVTIDQIKQVYKDIKGVK